MLGIGESVYTGKCSLKVFQEENFQTDLASYVKTIAHQLLIVAVTDRDVGVRRAAASALQELVGRHHNTLHSYTHLTEYIDFTSVSAIARCYSSHIEYLTTHNICTE